MSWYWRPLPSSFRITSGSSSRYRLALTKLREANLSKRKRWTLASSACFSLETHSLGALFSLERSALYYWHGDPGSGLKYITVRRGDGHVSPLREFEVCGVVSGELVAFGKHEHPL